MLQSAMIARLEQPSGPPNAVIAKRRNTRANSRMLLSLRKKALTSLFKEVRVFKVPSGRGGVGV